MGDDCWLQTCSLFTEKPKCSFLTYTCFRVLIHIVSLGNVKWPVLQSAKQQTFCGQKYCQLKYTFVSGRRVSKLNAKATGQLLINNVQIISLMSVQTIIS